MSVCKRVRSEAEVVVVKLGVGEFLQYLVSSPCADLRFSLVDVKTNEIILSEQASPTILAPPTFTRLWPLVGDRPQHESSLLLTMIFAEARHHCNFQIQHRRADGSWDAVMNIDFEASEGGDSHVHSFRVLAE